MPPQETSILHPSVVTAINTLIDRLNAPSLATLKEKSSTETKSESLTSTSSNPTVMAIFIGTSDGIGLARCYGTTHYSNNNMSEEILSSIENVWSTLPSSASQGASHFLRPLQMGTIRSSIAFYNDDTILIHLHLFPLMLTILVNAFDDNGQPANIGAIRSHFEGLRSVLEPLRRELENSFQQQTA